MPGEPGCGSQVAQPRVRPAATELGQHVAQVRPRVGDSGRRAAAQQRLVERLPARSLVDAAEDPILPAQREQEQRLLDVIIVAAPFPSGQKRLQRVPLAQGVSHGLSQQGIGRSLRVFLDLISGKIATGVWHRRICVTAID